MSWPQFYPSERWIFERLAARPGGIARVLDVGCAAGGLGLALQEKFPIQEYTGIELNDDAVALARSRLSLFRVHANFRCADIIKLDVVAGAPFDLVANLSCSDWSVDTDAITDACWRHVAPGGNLVISLRLTSRPGINDPSKSYARIGYEGESDETDELTNYVVFNVHDALRMFDNMNPRPSRVLGYGYWGAPSKSAVTPYERLVFAVFAVEKATEKDVTPTSELHFPLSLWTT
jgi:SAM-dependent methyltransferase